MCKNTKEKKNNTLRLTIVYFLIYLLDFFFYCLTKHINLCVLAFVSNILFTDCSQKFLKNINGLFIGNLFL